VVKDDPLPGEILFLDAAGKVKFLRAALAPDNEPGVVHVGDEAERFASGGAVLVTGVEVAKFIEAGGDAGQVGESFEEAGADVVLVAGGGGAGGEGHPGLVELFVEDVHESN
jgi:hypothetical protein